MPKARGPAPKPTRLKVVAGNPGKRKLNTAEPKPRQSVGRTPPTYLSKYAQEMWRELVPELTRLKLLTIVDYRALEMCCDSYSTWRLMREKIEKMGTGSSGFVSEAKSGYKQQAAEYTIMTQSMANFSRFLAEFGLSPAARTRIKLDAKDEGDAEDERFFG